MVRSEPLDGFKDACGTRQQISDIYSLTSWREWSEARGAFIQHNHGAMIIVALNVVQRDSDLQNALIQPPYWSEFFAPKIFENFVLCEEFALVEQGDASVQRRWRCFSTRREHQCIIGVTSSCQRSLYGPPGKDRLI